MQDLHRDNPFILQWGSWAEIATAIIALAAVIVAARALAHSRMAADAAQQTNQTTLLTYKRDTQEREEAQARFIYSTAEVERVSVGSSFVEDADTRSGVIEAGSATFRDRQHGYRVVSDSVRVRVAVHNDSQELIGAIVLSLCDARTLDGYGEAIISSKKPILPGKTAKFEIIARLHHPEDQTEVVLNFTDSSGRIWTRRGYRPIERLLLRTKGDVSRVPREG